MMRQIYHLVPYDGAWALVRENSKKALKQFDTKKTGLDESRKEVGDKDQTLVIHRQDGTVQEVVKPEKKASKHEQHVVPHEEGWAVLRANGKKPTNVYSTKTRAVAKARSIASNNESDVVIHDQQGSIHYKGDPHPLLPITQGAMS